MFIHIGRGKTGSSAFQQLCAQSHEILNDAGLFFPMSAGAERLVGHDTLAKAFIDEFPSYMKRPKHPRAALSDTRVLLQKNRTSKILVSSEQFELANPGLVREYFLTSLGNARFKVLYVLRDQVEVAESEYNQLVKIGRYSGPFRQFINEVFMGDFLPIANRWASTFGTNNVHCIPYFPDRDISVRLLEECGLRIGQLSPIKRIRNNRSLSFEQLIAIRCLYSLGKTNADPLLEQIRCASAETGTPALFFDVDEANRFRATYETSNKKLVSQFVRSDEPGLGGLKYQDPERAHVRELISNLGLI